jgi:hypothetical protein
MDAEGESARGAGDETSGTARNDDTMCRLHDRHLSNHHPSRRTPNL